MVDQRGSSQYITSKVYHDTTCALKKGNTKPALEGGLPDHGLLFMLEEVIHNICDLML